MGNDCEAWKREARYHKGECQRLEAELAVAQKEIAELRVANRAYWLRYGDPPEMPELEPA